MATQTGLAFTLYQNNVKITCEEFVHEFSLVFPSLPARIAALYWQNKARRAKFGLAPTALPKEFKVKDESKPTKEISPEKALADVGLKATVKPKKIKEKSPEKSADEIAAIKSANLARLKAVSARKKYSSVARPEGTGVDGFDADEAKKELAGVVADLDSFKAPKFLTKAQVKSLV